MWCRAPWSCCGLLSSASAPPGWVPGSSGVKNPNAMKAYEYLVCRNELVSLLACDTGRWAVPRLGVLWSLVPSGRCVSARAGGLGCSALNGLLKV